MRPLPILEHMKLLKAAIPVRQNKNQIDSQLPIFKQLKNIPKSHKFNNSGIFENLSFCLPFKQNADQQELAKFSELVKGIFHQGGKIVQFNEKMSEQFAKFVVVDQNTNLTELREKLSGLVKYEKILKYEFVGDSLKSLKRKDYQNYVIFDNTQNMNSEVTSSEKALRRLEEEEVDQKLIRKEEEEQFGKIQKTGSFERSKPDYEQELFKTSQIEKKEHQSKRSTMAETVQRPLEDSLEQQFTYKERSDMKEDSFSLEQNYDESEMNNQMKMIEQEKIEKEEENMLYYQQEDEKYKEKQKEKKNQRSEKYFTNTDYKEREKEVEDNTNQIPADPSVPWQPKADRKMVWYAPPKNLASHYFPRNNFICEKLKELQEIYKRTGNTRMHYYARAIASIKSHDKEIKHPDDLAELNGVNGSMKAKIKEIITTGHLSRMNKYVNKEEINVCKELQKVWGVGYKKAKEFYDMGIKSIEDLRKRPELITKNMAVGLKYFNQFQKRIPYDKVTRIFQEFRKIFVNMVYSDKMHHLVVVGSYRRGKATCGDIDILICRHDGSVQSKLLLNLVRELEEKKFMTESLSQPRVFDGKNNSAYMGVCIFEGQHHRIDIKHYPVEQYAFALMYFTGSDMFNRQMRMVAHNKGLLLSDHGLKKKERNGQKKIWHGGEIPILKTEQEIFKFLEQDYCKPSERQI